MMPAVGSAARAAVPRGIVVRGNHITRPASWREAGWSVKNLFELKNAADVIVDLSRRFAVVVLDQKRARSIPLSIDAQFRLYGRG